MPELTEDSPEVVLAAAFNSISRANALSDMGKNFSWRDRWIRTGEAARRLAAEGKLGPTPQRRVTRRALQELIAENGPYDCWAATDSLADAILALLDAPDPKPARGLIEKAPGIEGGTE